MIEREELKPCPFCGGRAEMRITVKNRIEEQKRGKAHLVMCKVCRASSGSEFDEDKAVEKWNRRTDDGKFISN